MKSYRHIITKAIIGKGKEKIETKSILSLPHRPNRILGCWIVNHQYQARKQKNEVEVTGQFELNIWYAYGGSKKTAVHAELISYKEHVHVHYENDSLSKEEVYIKKIDDPECEKAVIEEDGKVCVESFSFHGIRKFIPFLTTVESPAPETRKSLLYLHYMKPFRKQECT